MECKKDIEDLIENIDEFKEKYVTYRSKTLRTILVKTLDYIKRKEQECEELKRKIKYMEEYIKTVENSRNEFEKENTLRKIIKTKKKEI